MYYSVWALGRVNLVRRLFYSPSLEVWTWIMDNPLPFVGGLSTDFFRGELNESFSYDILTITIL